MTKQTELSAEDKGEKIETKLSTEDKALVEKMKQRARNKPFVPPLMVLF